ncbi:MULTISPECIES: COP23 domain-containing protein [unclassified Anabaena]|uniref:COP23 domain-containing protein n=1 Tax=unclassified Anabaena TaxID=2619674 RepID=UPI00083787E1|nr:MULTISPECIES: COP23 domain-containing protein [unclassified Anabaena]
MLSKSWKLACLGGLSLSLFLGNGVAFAQFDNSTDSVVVPTVPSGSSTPTTTTTPFPTDTSVNTSTATTTVGNARFVCQQYNGQYTVMYQPQSQPGQFFSWATPAALGGGWNPQLRCQTIANRLELYRPDGLQELQVSVLNNENIVCVTSEADPSCRIVLTVPRNRDPYNVRNSIFQNLMSADNGQQTIAVNTYTNRGGNELYNLGRTLLGNGNRVNSLRSGINLKPYLDVKDGGTGRNLRNGVAIRRQTPAQVPTRLNPDRFR